MRQSGRRPICRFFLLGILTGLAALGFLSWRPSDGAFLAGWQDSQSPRDKFNFSEDGKWSVGGGNSLEIVRVRDVRTGQVVREINRRFTGPTLGEPLASFGPAGIFATHGNTDVQLWDVTSGKKLRDILRTKARGLPRDIAWSKDHALIAVSFDSETVVHTLSGDLVRTIPHATGRLLFSPAGHILMATGYFSERAVAEEISFWDVDTGLELARLPRPPNETGRAAAAFFPDGRRVVLGGPLDGTGSIVWDLPTLIGADDDLSPDFPRLGNDQIWQRLDSDDPATGMRAASALAKRPDEAVALIRERLLTDPGERRPALATLTLAWCSTPEARDLLQGYVRDKDIPEKVRAAATASLPRFAPSHLPVPSDWTGLLEDAGSRKKAAPARGASPAKPQP